MADQDVGARVQQQLRPNTLETVPTSPAHTAHGDIPNTPLMASTIAFSLGILFTLGFPLDLSAGLSQSSGGTLTPSHSSRHHGLSSIGSNSQLRPVGTERSAQWILSYSITAGSTMWLIHSH